MEDRTPGPLVVRSTRRLWTGITTGTSLWAFYLVAYGTGSLHLVEVHLLDAWAAQVARDMIGSSFVHWTHLEAGLFRLLDRVVPDALLASFTVYYLWGFVALLLVVPPLIAMTGDRALLKRTLLAYPVAWGLAVPFNLFVPSTNPYTALGLTDPFALVHPELPRLYYALTTVDNTFPSLHVTFTVILVLAMVRSRHELLKGAFVVHGVLIVSSVLVLKVHYVADVVAGLGAAWLSLRIVDRLLAPSGRVAGVGRLLVAVSRGGDAGRQRSFCRVEGALPWLAGAAGDAEGPAPRRSPRQPPEVKGDMSTGTG